MNIDSLNTATQFSLGSPMLPDSFISFSLFIIALCSFLFTLYKYVKLKKSVKPIFTYLSLVNEEHFVAIIVSGFSGAIAHPKFYISKLHLKYIRFSRTPLQSKLIENKKEIERIGSEIPKTSFNGEQLFWLFLPKSFEFSKGKYKIYGKTSVGVCSTIYQQTEDSLINQLLTLHRKSPNNK